MLLCVYRTRFRNRIIALNRLWHTRMMLFSSHSLTPTRRTKMPEQVQTDNASAEWRWQRWGKNTTQQSARTIESSGIFSGDDEVISIDFLYFLKIYIFYGWVFCFILARLPVPMWCASIILARQFAHTHTHTEMREHHRAYFWAMKTIWYSFYLIDEFKQRVSLLFSPSHSRDALMKQSLYSFRLVDWCESNRTTRMANKMKHLI